MTEFIPLEVSQPGFTQKYDTNQLRIGKIPIMMAIIDKNGNHQYITGQTFDQEYSIHVIFNVLRNMEKILLPYRNIQDLSVIPYEDMFFTGLISVNKNRSHYIIALEPRK